MKFSAIPLLLLSLFFVACKKDKKPEEKTPDVKVETPKSFLPMQVGNYWKKDKFNYTEITDSVHINGKLYYKFSELIDGDGLSTSYLSIDENNQLWASSPTRPELKGLVAKFDANVSHAFYTYNDRTVNDLKTTVVKKSADSITFTYTMIYHPLLSGQVMATSTYVRGRGLAGDWIGIKINGKVIK